MASMAPKAFPLDDRRIYDYYIASRASAALAAGVRLGLFDLLASAPLPPATIAERLRLPERPVRLLLAALLAMGLVVEERDAFGLAADAAAYLVRGRPGWLGGLIDIEVEHFLAPALLLDAMRKDDASVYGDADPWDRHARDTGQAEAFTRAMHSISERPAAALADALDLSATRRLLDVGGGSGVFAIALAEAWPELRCSLLDLATICRLAQAYVDEAGLSDRIDLVPRDMFADPWPAPVDAVLLSQILHDWEPGKGAILVRKAFDALAPGGRILVHEKLVDDDGRGPLANALVNLDMMVWTRGQQWTEAGLRRLLEAAGFTAVERRHTTGYWSVVTAVRTD